jgi:mycoredoxin
MTSSAPIAMYGAEWCSDCRRTKAQLDALGVDYRYIDIEQDAAMAQEAQRIAGRMNIPVVLYPDGSHQVEPTNTDVESRLRELSLL